MPGGPCSRMRGYGGRAGKSGAGAVAGAVVVLLVAVARGTSITEAIARS